MENIYYSGILPLVYYFVYYRVVIFFLFRFVEEESWERIVFGDNSAVTSVTALC